jgi:hypothetical protein
MEDPHIQAFTVLSDQVSYVEEMVVALYERKRRKEFSAVGQLDHRLLGFPFELWRWPERTADLDPDSEEPIRKERARPDKVSTAILVFNPELHWRHPTGCTNPALFSPDEMERVSNCRGHKVLEATPVPSSGINDSMEDTLDRCVTTDDAEIDTHLPLVCEEGIRRKLRWTAKTDYQHVFSDVDLLRNFDGCLSVRVEMTVDLVIDELVKLVLALMAKAGGDLTSIKRLDIYPCEQSLFRSYLKYLRAPMETLTRADIPDFDNHAFYYLLRRGYFQVNV